ncbi:myosin head [Ancylostoma caninum]|uniref:Myosin head n=1 Tax=Ancylostoma caninum TaxID=29170 RepID=A0A368G590_ANCCA|nr:myosin head [Ancylostoma caninum]
MYLLSPSCHLYKSCSSSSFLGCVEVELLDSHERQRVSRDDYQKVNPPRFDKCEDMSSMSCLNEASVLHNLKQRYYSNLIYTYSGLFCVVVNPYKRLPIYTESIAEQYKGRKRKEMPPHIFAVTDEAYRNMLQDREDQSILCTGESGAGKTENTKKVIQYLAYVAATRSHKGRLEEQLLQANPILEAFGNSKTIKNDNSSRFGKFIRIHFDASGCISGANIEFYLLEKSRILRQSAMERCFHIFYQLLRGARHDQRESLLLESGVDKYHFFSNGDITIPGVDDANEYAETLRAMDIVGFQESEIQGILRIVSAVMLFGNLQFSQESRNSDQAVLSNDGVAQKICTLLGLNLAEVMKAFLRPKIKVGREYVHRSQNEEQAKFSVEAISKACYERLFRWLVQRLNKSLDRTRQHAISFVGILDIAGFEIFEMNSFEQLCINYTNEKLQQLFNNTMFEKEQQEYLNEGLEWDMIDFGLNLKPTIDLIEKPMGVLSTLDDVCLFPQGNDAGFVERLAAHHQHHPKYIVPEMRSKSDFAIVHYAGRVDYQAMGWRVKNMDPLNENVVELLQLSKDPLVCEIWKDVSDMCCLGATEVGEAAAVFGARVKKGMFRTVSQMHKEQLSRLMTTLNNTAPHFVRCIIPNHEKKHGVLNAHLVLDQLRCNGVLEGIRICRQGFPNRITFQEFRQRYERLLAPQAIPHGFMDGREAVRRILEAIDVQPSLYRIGQSKVFFRTGVIAGLEEDRDEKLSALVIRFQALCRGVLARRNFNQRREQATAIRILQRNGRAWMRLREWQWWRLFTKVKPLLEVTNKDIVIAEKEQELRSTSEKLRRSEIFISDMSRTLEKFGEERNRLQEKLDMEAMERAEADEARQRIAARKMELEASLDQLEKQLRAEEQRREAAERDRKKLQENVRDLELQLEQEERARQNLHIEKVEVEKKLRDLETRNVEHEESAGRLGKEKRVLEERVKDISARLIDEEEKAKSLLKQKNKADIALVELQEELERERQARSDVEAAKRLADADLREERDSAAERLRKIEEFSQILSRKDTELAQVRLSYDEEIATRQQLERSLRDLQSQLDEAIEDLKQEQMLRSKAEKARRDLSEEVESYKLELEETQDKTASHHAMRTKREEEYNQLQNQLSESIREADERYEALRSKHQKQLEEFGEEMDQLKKSKAAAEKARAQLESDLANTLAELNNVQSLRSESERRRKMAENQLTDQANRLQQYCEENEQLVAKLNRVTNELDVAAKARESDVEKNGNLLKKIANLEMTIAEMTEASEEANKNRSTLVAKLRKAEDEIAALLDAQEDIKQASEKAEKEIASLKSQIAEARKRFDDELEQHVADLQRKAARDLTEALNRAEEADAAREKAERAKLKAQQEADDATREVTEIAAALREYERKHRKIDQQFAEEKANTSKAISERDAAQQQARDAETRFLNAVKESKELQEQIETMEKERRLLRLEVDNLASTKDDAGKNMFELEKAKKRLEEELAEARDQIVELEDALQMADDAKTRGEVMLQAAKQDWERQLSQRSEEEEDQRRSLNKRLRELEEEIGIEQRLRTQTLQSKKKLEAQLQTLQEDMEHLAKQNEEANRQLRRVNMIVKEAETEGAEARAAMDEALCKARDFEKRLRTAEAEVSRLTGDLSAVQAARRKVEAERDDLAEELSSIQQGGLIGQDEKKRYEKRIADLQEMVEEEQTSNELVNEKLKKAQAQVEQLTSELTMERSMCERADADKATLERALRDLKVQLQDAEANAAARARTQIATAEAKAQMLEQQLQNEEQEKNRICRQLRRLESRLMEMNVQFEEEKRQTEQQRESSERANSRYKSERRRATELEEELNTANSKCRELSRQLLDANEANDALTREVNALRARVAIAGDRRMMSSTRDIRRYGSNNSLSRGEDYIPGLGRASSSVGGSEDARPSSRTTPGGSTYGPSDDGDSIKT